MTTPRIATTIEAVCNALLNLETGKADSADKGHDVGREAVEAS
ncbi:MAG: hypothetical protein P8Z33_09510 [Gammaproteobacteria bacterium]|jgi:hypothetical protein